MVPRYLVIHFQRSEFSKESFFTFEGLFDIFASLLEGFFDFLVDLGALSLAVGPLEVVKVFLGLGARWVVVEPDVLDSKSENDTSGLSGESDETGDNHVEEANSCEGDTNVDEGDNQGGPEHDVVDLP